MKKAQSKPLNRKSGTVKNKPEQHPSFTEPKMSVKVKLCILLGVLSFLVYANTLQNGYVGDDDLFITYNGMVNKGIKGIPEILTSARMTGIQTGNNDTYRPTSLIMFAVEVELFGFNPTTGHVGNVVLFSACVVLLFLFLDRLMEQKKTAVAFVAALLFAVHPVHTEVVANIKSRDELLCFFFAFWSLNLFITHFEKGKIAPLIAGCFTLFLSFLSKETSISFLIIIPLIFFFYYTGNRKRSIFITAATLVAVVLFLGIRTIVLHGLSPGNSALSASADNQLLNVPANASGLATAILACGYYIKLLFVPYPLLCTYSFSTIPFVSFSDYRVVLSIIAYVFLAIAGFYRLIKFPKDPWAFGILFYLSTIALFSNVLFLIPALFAERFLFFASVGFCLLIALLIEKWWFGLTKQKHSISELSVLMKAKVLIFLVPILVVFTSMTISRNSDWENDYLLLKRDIEHAPRNARLYRNMGFVLNKNLNNEALRAEVRKRLIEKGIFYFNQALSINPLYADAYTGLGQLYRIKKNYDSAEICEQNAIRLDPANDLPVDNLGVIYYETNRFPEALELFKKVIQMNSRLEAEYRKVGLCYFQMHQYEAAIASFRKALEAMPEDSRADEYKSIADCFRATGKMDSAAKYEHLAR